MWSMWCNIRRLTSPESPLSTTRMYKGAPPRLDANRIFGVTTLELG